VIPANVLVGLKYGGCAKDEITKALELDPKAAMNHVSQGVGDYYLPPALGGGVDKAIQDFQKAITLDGKSAEAYLWLGIALRKAGRNAEAHQALEKIAGPESGTRVRQAAACQDTGEIGCATTTESMSLYDLDPGPDCPERVRMIVEIPKNSVNKFEYDSKLGVFRLDRPLYSPLHYPGDYGFVPGNARRRRRSAGRARADVRNRASPMHDRGASLGVLAMIDNEEPR